MDYLSNNISANLKRIRKARGMSLDVVAEQTGVSKSMLAQIEKGTGNPSIGILGRIVSGLRIDFNELISPPPAEAMLVRVPDTDPSKCVPGQYRVWTCFPYQDTHTAEIYRIELEQDGCYPAGGHGEHTREYLTVLEGTLQVELSDASYTVGRDDVLRFESDRDHTYRSIGDGRCVFMCTFVAYQ